MSDADEHAPRGEDFNEGILAEFRANQGKVGGLFENMNLALLTTTGAKTGRRTTTPITYFTEGRRYLLVASNFGRDHHPAWFYNVLQDPMVTLEIGTEQFRGRATITEGAERDRLFAYVSEKIPGYRKHQSGTTRIIPVVVIERVE